MQFHFDFEQLYFRSEKGKILKQPNAVPVYKYVTQIYDFPATTLDTNCSTVTIDPNAQLPLLFTENPKSSLIGLEQNVYDSGTQNNVPNADAISSVSANTSAVEVEFAQDELFSRSTSSHVGLKRKYSEYVPFQIQFY